MRRDQLTVSIRAISVIICCIGQRGLISFEMRQAKVSNLEVTIIWQVTLSANNKDVGWIDIVMPARC